MARRRRHFFKGAILHVIFRGNKGQSVFSSDEERCRFCLLMQEGVERFGHRILAFCFMTNHIHLAIQVNEVSLSKICQNLLFRYTVFCNKRHKTVGHLFQGRFKSVLVDSDRYLKELVRYIHLNPVRAYLVADPLQYRWSSHQAYMMKEEFTWLSMDECLQRFSKSRSEAVKAFYEYVNAGINLETDIDFHGGYKEGILGDDEFVEKVQQQFEHSAARSLSVDFKTLLSFITNWYDIDPEIVRAPGMERRSSHIRSVIALFIRDMEGASLQQLANFCGREASGMSKAAARLEARMVKSSALKAELESLKVDLFGALTN
jgi:putative transposase